MRAGVGGRAELAGVVGPGGLGGDERHGRMVEGLEPRRVELRFGFHRGAQHGAGLAQPLAVVLLGAAAQREQRHRRLVRTHHLALAAQQGIELLAQLGEGRVLAASVLGP